MWDWTSSKNPPPYKGRDPEADDALEQGITPEHPPYYGFRRDPRIIPYKDPRDREDISPEESYTVPPFIPIHEDISLKKEASRTGLPLEIQELAKRISPSSPVQDFSRPSVVEVGSDAGIWEWQFSQFNLGGMELKEVEISLLDTNARGELRRAFKRARRDFIRYIAYYNEAELVSAGVDENGIRNLKRGKTPENFDVHLKIPFEYSGTNDFSNLLFIQTHPYHDDIHKFIDMQVTSQPFGCKLSKLYVPVCEGKVYIPADSSSIGGGKGKGDKTSVQGYSASALQKMAISKSMDRGANI